MDSVKIEGGGAQAVLHRQTNRMQAGFRRFYRVVIRACLPRSNDEWGLAWAWATLAAQSSDVTGLAYALPQAADTDDDILRCYNAFLDDTNTDFSTALINGANALVTPRVPEQAPGDVEQADPNSSGGGEAGSKKR